jgi:N-methylhydantoinase A/oxoprolinase/acetone carboxylase beta subunit
MISSVSLTPAEKNIYDRIKDDTPVSLSDILWDMKYVPTDVFKSLVSKKAVHMIGFTPTDVLHILEEYNEFDKRASIEGARILASVLEMDAKEFCAYLKHAFASKMAQKIVHFLGEKGLCDNAENITADHKAGVFNASARFETKPDSTLASSPIFNESVKAFLSFKKPMIQYKINVPIVMIGGPVGAYTKELNQLIDARFITPPYFDVGNAVGALVGKIAKRIEISIRSVYSESNDAKSAGFVVYFPGGRHAFSSRAEALEYAHDLGKKLIFDYMSSESIPAEKVNFRTEEENIGISQGAMPTVTKLVFEGYAKNVF